MGPSDRFWTHVARGDGCWEWQSTRHTHGYGLFWDGRKQVRAHRYAWEMEHGPIPPGQSVLHSCDNRRCVRLDHLRLGTQRDNMADMDARCRRAPTALQGIDQRGERNRASKLTHEQVAHIRGMADAGHYHDDIARQFGVTAENVSYIARRDTWSDVAPIPYPRAARTRRVGRPPRLTAEQVAEARRRYTGQRGEMTALAREYGVSLTTMFRALAG